MKRIQEAFDSVHAEEALKESTRQFLQEKRRPALSRSVFRTVPVLACLLFVLLGLQMYQTPTVQISIDINPSVELSVNRFDRVIRASGLNGDGTALLETMQLQNLNWNQAVDRIVESDRVRNLLSEDAVLEISVIGGETAQTEKMLTCVKALSSHSENIHCYYARPEEVADAHALGLSYGKYRAYLELHDLDETVTPQQVQAMTMRQIRDQIRAHAPETESSPDSCGAGQHNGQGRQYGKGKGKNAE